MSKLMYLQASPRAERSHSRAVADAFVAAYRKAHPADAVETVDLFKADLPTFDGLAVQAKYAIMHGKEHSGEERAAWRAVEALIERFKSADKYVLAIPMWNFGVPYRLKQYFDLVIQPGYTFAFDPEKGYSGLVTGKPILCVYARGGAYSEGTGLENMDMQKRYVDLALGFMGFTEIHSLIVEPTLHGGPGVALEKRQAAIDGAVKLAETF